MGSLFLKLLGGCLIVLHISYMHSGFHPMGDLSPAESQAGRMKKIGAHRNEQLGRVHIAMYKAELRFKPKTSLTPKFGLL